MNRLHRFLIRTCNMAQLLPKASRSLRGTVVDQDRYGNRWLLNLENIIDSTLYLTGAYEPQEVETFTALAEQHGCTVFVDIGANIGFYSVVFARKPFIKEIYAFEPDPRNYSQFQAALWLNQLQPRMRTYAMAITEETGEIELKLSPRNGASSNGAQTIKVPAARLDDIFAMNNQKIAIKIDVEGHELSVLKGMEVCFRHNDCLLLIEVMDSNPNAQAIHAILSEYGYIRHGTRVDNNFFYVKAPQAQATPAA